MQPTEKRTEIHYKVRFYDRARKKWYVSRYAMPIETAKQHYGDTEWHIIPASKVERTVGGDPLALSLSRFQRKS